MSSPGLAPKILALAACAALANAAVGQSAPATPATIAPANDARVADAFAPPVRLKAGGKLLGKDRMYPSPVLHDVNGDGALDLVIGDLRGALTVALRKPGADRLAFEAETKVKGVDGEELDFHNW